MKYLITLICFLLLATSSLAAEIRESDARVFLDDWLAAQNTGSYSKYAAMYSANFVGIRRSGTSTRKFDHDAWLEDRKRMFRKKMIVTANNPEIAISDATASIKFEQIWESGTYKDIGVKLLQLVRENDKLIIIREEMLFSKVQPGNDRNNKPGHKTIEAAAYPDRSQNSEVKFTSIYTNLQKDCKDKFTDSDGDHDMPVICKGPGGYWIDVEYSACCEHMQVEGGNNFLLLFPEQRIVTVTKRRMEWRLANGKPFAVIFRIDKYKGDITLDPKKHSEVFIVKGLNGFEHIDFEVDPKKHSDPNIEARKLADQSYMQRSK